MTIHSPLSCSCQWFRRWSLWQNVALSFLLISYLQDCSSSEETWILHQLLPLLLTILFQECRGFGEFGAKMQSTYLTPNLKQKHPGMWISAASSDQPHHPKQTLLQTCASAGGSCQFWSSVQNTSALMSGSKPTLQVSKPLNATFLRKGKACPTPFGH